METLHTVAVVADFRNGLVGTGFANSCTNVVRKCYSHLVGAEGITMGYSSCTDPYNTPSLCLVMLLSIQSLRCVILYCNVGWCIKDGAVYHSCQQWLEA